jgi:DNA-binding NtrC family response regulator
MTLTEPGTKHAHRKTAILAVSGNQGDLKILGRLFMGSSWELRTAETLDEAREQLQREPVPVILCESWLPDGDWKALLRVANELTNPPKVVVTSRLADDRFWAEALNLGAFDVLAAPANQKEVFRALSSAWRNWKDRQQQLHTPVNARSKAGGAGA